MDSTGRLKGISSGYHNPTASVEVSLTFANDNSPAVLETVLKHQSWYCHFSRVYTRRNLTSYMRRMKFTSAIVGIQLKRRPMGDSTFLQSLVFHNQSEGTKYLYTVRSRSQPIRGSWMPISFPDVEALAYLYTVQSRYQSGGHAYLILFRKQDLWKPRNWKTWRCRVVNGINPEMGCP